MLNHSILAISDTHGQHRALGELPEADVLVHSGDFTQEGTEQEACDFMNWLCDLPHKHKIFIAGNHDLCMHGATRIEGLPDNVHYLCNSGVEIFGLRFYGVPMFVQDIQDGSYAHFIQQIPDHTDILITHQPPFSICDLADYGNGPTHHGNKQLLERVTHLAPRCHLFGHEHDAYAMEAVGRTLFSNASLLDSHFHLINPPRRIVL